MQSVILKTKFTQKITAIGKGKCETREHAVGMRIARLCYTDYLIGSSKINFEQEILKFVLEGLDVSDINHSSEFYSNFMPFVSEQVTERLKSFFSSRQDHTRFKPPVNLQSSNAHRSRQFTSVLTVVTESPKLLTYIYLDQPVVKSHDGPGVTRNIIDELNSWDIQGDQVEDGSFYGQYLAFLRMLQKLSIFRTNLFVRGILSIKGGVVDNHIREYFSFSWLVESRTVCREIFSTFNWGKNYEIFCKSAKI